MPPPAQRLEPAGRVADPLGKDTDRVPGRERVGYRREGLGVLRRVDALVQLAIDRNRSRARDERTERAVEERGLGEESDVTAGRRPDDGGIEERVGMVGQEQQGAIPRDLADAVGPVEDPTGGPGEPADRGVRSRAHCLPPVEWLRSVQLAPLMSDRRQTVSVSACRAARRPASTSTNIRIAAPTTKKPSTASIAFRLCPVASTMAAKTSGPRMPA